MRLFETANRMRVVCISPSITHFARLGRPKVHTPITERSLVTTCRLVNTTRSDNNPQGFLLEELLIVENKDMQTYDR